ncbi:MFS transporter [soil metagenome]
MDPAAPDHPAPTPAPVPSADPSAVPGLKSLSITPRVGLVLLLLINLFNYIDRSIMSAVLPTVQEEFYPGSTGLGAAKTAASEHANANMGLLATAFLVSYMCAAPIFGFFASRWSRWWIVGLGVALWSLASGGSGLANSFGLLLLMRILVGVGEAAYGPVAPTLISDMYPLERRGTVMAWFYMAIPVGSALGYAFGGQFASPDRWHWAFLATVPPGILLAVWCCFMRDPRSAAKSGIGAPAALKPAAVTPAPGGRTAPAAHGWPAYREFLTNPSWILCTLGMTALTFAIGGISFWMPSYVAIDRFHADTNTLEGQATVARVNLTFGLITVVCGITATLVGGYLADHLRTRIRGAYLVVSGIAMIIGFPLFVAMLYTPFPAAWFFLGASVFFLFLNTGPSNTVLANVTHPRIRAQAFAVNILIIHALGDAISPYFIGVMTDRFHSRNGAFVLVAVVVLLGGVLWLWGSRYVDRDTARIAALPQ